MDASYKIQRGIHVHLIQFFMCPEFWVHISCQWQRPRFLGRPAPGVPNRAQRSGSVGERRSKGAEGDVYKRQGEDGGLIGGASLKVPDIVEIVNAANQE